MQDLFYMLLGIAVIVLPIYLIVKAIKNKGNKEKDFNKGLDIVKEEKKESKKRNAYY